MSDSSLLAVRSVAVLGAGYVGGAFVREAVAAGLRVSALTRNPAKAAELRGAGCAQVVEADLAGDGWHSQLRGPFDFVLNCVSAGGGGVAGYRHSYVDGMRSLGRWLATQPAGGTVVYTSSTGVYPQGEGQRVTEESPTEGAGETGQVLREAEVELGRGAREAGWRWFVLRLAGIYGPGRHGMLDQLRAGAAVLPGDPAHHMNLIHRDDACAAAWSCFAAPAAVRDEIFNVTDGTPALRAEVAEWMAQRLDVKCPGFGDAAVPAAGGNPFGARRRGPDRIVDSTKLRRVLGWSPKFADYRAGYVEGMLNPEG
jgi:nucleoside-diphosphate-sugar epimerase